jgi:hypothetical protein
MDLPKIAVFPATEFSRRKRMLQALGELYDVEFLPTDNLNAHSTALIFGTSRQESLSFADSGIRCLAFIAGQVDPICSSTSKVDFPEEAPIANCFRGRSLHDGSLKHAHRLEVMAGEQVIARKGENILWIRRSGSAAPLDMVAVDLPELDANEYLFKYFHHESWAGLLPVLQFLQEVSPWTPPPLRACFMFDDPNLHWESYGYVDFREIARQAAEFNYHVAFATVPMDAWYVDRKAASLFKQEKNRLSLLIHGNNHTTYELISTRSDNWREALGAQAIRRIERLERTSGLEVSRVMAAPHGACNHEMASALVRTGFEAACISRGSLMGRNPGVDWPKTIGLSVSEFLGGGLPVIPRFNIRFDKNSEFSALLAAFLRQPIIPVGHHSDLADGLGVLNKLSSWINSIGNVRWSDMQSIAHTNFCTNRAGALLNVKMYSRRIRLTVPESVTQLVIHRPWVSDNGETFIVSDGASAQGFQAHKKESIRVIPASQIEISSIHPEKIDPWTVRVRSTPLWAFARRQLCEARDRLRPTYDWFRRSGRKAAREPVSSSVVSLSP